MMTTMTNWTSFLLGNCHKLLAVFLHDLTFIDCLPNIFARVVIFDQLDQLDGCHSLLIWILIQFRRDQYLLLFLAITIWSSDIKSGWTAELSWPDPSISVHLDAPNDGDLFDRSIWVRASSPARLESNRLVCSLCFFFSNYLPLMARSLRCPFKWSRRMTRLDSTWPNFDDKSATIRFDYR